MMGTFSSQDIAGATAPKLPPGTETPSILRQILLGVTAQLLIVGISTTAVKEFLDQIHSGNLDSDELIQQAQSQELDETQQLAATKLGSSDYETILQYSFN